MQPWDTWEGVCAFSLLSWCEREQVIPLLYCWVRCLHTDETRLCLTSHCLAVYLLVKAMWKIRDGLGATFQFSWTDVPSSQHRLHTPSPTHSTVPWKVRRMMSPRRSLLPCWWSSSWRQNCRCDNSVTSGAEICKLFRANWRLPLDAQQHFDRK